MTQSTLFWLLLVTLIMAINAARETSRRNYAIAALFVAVPAAGWASILFGR